MPYEGLARVLIQLKQRPDALKTSEFIRARVFAESIAKRSKGSTFNVPDSVLKEDKDLDDRLAALKKQRQKAYEKNNKLQIEALEPQISELTAKRQAHIAILREQYPLFAATTYPKPMPLKQAALKPDEWVLAYDVTDPGITVYLTHGKELQKAFCKPVPRKAIDEMVRSLREPLSVKSGDSLKDKLTTFNFKAGYKLADILLAEMLPFLPHGASVIIVPEDSLGAIPFEMLTLNDQGTVSTGQDIPMSEVISLKMNANIVALTACQTGLGRNLSGEGPMSMGRTFQYAGAQAVLMSLWSVAEETSVKLVESFFRRRKQGKSKLESLRLARQEIRDSGYDHPFFWARFILAGEVE